MSAPAPNPSSVAAIEAIDLVKSFPGGDSGSLHLHDIKLDGLVQSLGGRQFRLPGGAVLVAGDDACGEILAIRPERMRLIGQGEGNLSGVVEQVVYSGTATLYEIALAGGLALRVRTPNDARTTPRAVVGETVGISGPAGMIRRAALLAPATIWIVVFLALPLGLMAYVSTLQRGTGGGIIWGAHTTDAYVQFLFERDLMDRLVVNTDYLRIFGRSIWLAGLTTVLCAAIGLPTALWMAFQPQRRRLLLVFIVTVPFWTNLLVRTYAWILLLRTGGVVEQVLALPGFGTVRLDILYTPAATLIGLVYSFLPYMILPIYVSLEKLDRRLIEAAFDLGANKWRMLRRVILPLSLPGLFAGVVLVFVPGLGAFISPELLGGAKTMMIGGLIQQQFGQSRNWPFGAALSFVLLAMVLLALAGDAGMTGAALWRIPGAATIGMLAIGFLYLPIIVLVALSFSAEESLAGWSGFSLRWYEEVFADANMLLSLQHSLTVAAAATSFTTVAATMAAVALDRARFRGRDTIEALLGLPLVVPEIVAGIAVLLFFVLIGLRLGLVSVIVAHIVLIIPLAYLPIRARLSGLDPALQEAASDLYAGPWAGFRRITLPLIWPGIVAGAMLAFIGSLGDVVVSYFVAGPGATTLPVYVFAMVRMGVSPEVNAASTLLLLASVAVFSLASLLSRRFT
eukprot:gene2094-2131_t